MIKILNIDSEQFESIKSFKQRAIVVKNNNFQLDDKLCLMEDVEVDELETQDSLTVLVTDILKDDYSGICVDYCMISFQLLSMNHRQLLPLEVTEKQEEDVF